MSHFSNKLKALVLAKGTATAFADLAGLSGATISRLLNKGMAPDDDSLSKICRILSERDAAELIEARLRDVIPGEFRSLVQITPGPANLREEMPIPDIFRRLSPENRATVAELCRLCLNDDDVADAMRRFVRLVSPEWAKSQDSAR